MLGYYYPCSVSDMYNYLAANDETKHNVNVAKIGFACLFIKVYGHLTDTGGNRVTRTVALTVGQHGNL